MLVPMATEMAWYMYNITKLHVHWGIMYKIWYNVCSNIMQFCTLWSITMYQLPTRRWIWKELFDPRILILQHRNIWSISNTHNHVYKLLSQNLKQLTFWISTFVFNFCKQYILINCSGNPTQKSSKCNSKFLVTILPFKKFSLFKT